MIHYHPISPLDFFDLIEDIPYAFVLAQYWPHEKYRRFYLEHDWEIVIVDNGIYEGAPVTEAELDAIGRQISGERVFVVAPEVMKSSIGTVQAVREFVKKYSGTKPYEVMVVLQGETIAVLPDFAEKVDPYVDAYAVPIWMYRKGWCRAGVVKWFKEVIPETREKYWHALGLDCLLELKELQGFVESFDTSMPFTAAVHGLDLEHNLIIKRVKRVNLLGEAFDERVRRLARKNVETILKWCGP